MLYILVSCHAAGQEVQNRHSNRHTIVDLLPYQGTRTIGDFASYLEAPIHRPGVQYDTLRSAPREHALRDAELATVLIQVRDKVVRLPFELHTQTHYHIEPLETLLEIVTDRYAVRPKALDELSRHERRRANEPHPIAERYVRPHIAAHDPRVAHVADESDRKPLNLSLRLRKVLPEGK
jgi:hypothetical protein